MTQVILLPHWFSSIGSFFELLGLIIMVTIASYCYFKYYKLSHIDSYKHFSLAFGAMSIAFLGKILMNVGVIHKEVTKQVVGTLLLTTSTVHYSNVLLTIGSTLYYFFFLTGLLLLWVIVYKEEQKATLVLLFFFIVITTLFSNASYFVFYLTSAFFLFMIFAKYWNNFLTKPQKRAGLLLALSFLIIFLSQLVFIFVSISQSFYVIAELIQLMGFLLLLVTFIMAIKS